MKSDHVAARIMFSRPDSGIWADRTGAPMRVLVERGGDFVYSKGHHDACEFCQQAESKTGIYYDFGMVQYRWVRMLPRQFATKKDQRAMGDCNWIMKDAQPGIKGAFPITCCEASLIQ